MAIIYPDKFPADIFESRRRRGERLLYTALSRSNIKDIRIYYSRLWRQVASNKSNLSLHFNGEVDFIVFIPPLGFLFIECKGGVVSQNSNGFFSQDKTGRVFQIKPLEQAKRSMYSFVNHVLASKLCDLDRNGLLSICQYAAFFSSLNYRMISIILLI